MNVSLKPTLGITQAKPLKGRFKYMSKSLSYRNGSGYMIEILQGENQRSFPRKPVASSKYLVGERKSQLDRDLNKTQIFTHDNTE